MLTLSIEKRDKKADLNVLKKEGKMPAVFYGKKKESTPITLLKKDFEETGATSEDSEGFISYPRAVEGVEVAISYKEIGDKKYKASLRSKLYVDVAKIAENFGGGGHIRASGCKLQGSLEEVQQQMMAAILPEIN